MLFKILFISVAMLLCITAQIFSLTNTASADGCGVNPLGDTSGDTDFYVSKNQNLPTSGTVSPASTISSEAGAAMPLGSLVEQTKGNVTLQSLDPQEAGSAIIWTANATNPNDEDLVFDFFRKGPATNGELIEKTGWIAENSWTWNTSEDDVGENQVQVWVKRLDAGEAENIKAQNYTISAPTSEVQVADAAASTEKSTSSGLNPHPGGKTADNEVGEAFASKSSTASSDLNPYPGGKTANLDVSKPKPAPDESGSADVAGSLSDGSVGGTQDPSAAASDAMDVGGKWTVDLIGSGCTLDANLIQTGESIVGMGSLIERNTKIPQTFKGTVTSSSMRLQSNAVIDEFGNDIDKSVSLYLEKADRIISGSYEIYSGDELMATGNATASRFSS